MSLQTITRGTGSARLVWLHGLFGQGRNFNTVAGLLTDVATSLLVDLPNHGHSVWTDRFDYDLFADLVADQLRTEFGQHQPVNLVGHSMGGKVAMRLALRHPDLVQRLIVLDIAPIARPDTSEFANHLAALLALDLAALTSRRSADEALRPAIPNPATRAFLLQNLVRDPAGGWRWLANFALLQASLTEMASWPASTRRWSGPVLWLAGERSGFVPRTAEAAMQRHFPQASLVEILDAGHWVHADQPRAVASAIADFLVKPLPAAEA